MQSEFEIKQWDGDEEKLNQYAQLLSQVYKRDISFAHILWKHKLNPLGASPITYAQNVQGDMVAARAFWPMYSVKAPLYQPCDTVTHPDFQRLGLFSKLTLAGLQTLPDDAAIINFPNHSSFPGYLKLGWQLLENNLKVFGYKLPLGLKAISDLAGALQDRVNPDHLAYLLWRFSPQSGKNYRFWLSANYLLVSDGQQSGAIMLEAGGQPFGSAPGVASGYVLPSRFSMITGLAKGCVALKCQSRTAFFLQKNAQRQTIEDCLDRAQVNVLMDTF